MPVGVLGLNAFEKMTFPLYYVFGGMLRPLTTLAYQSLSAGKPGGTAETAVYWG